MTEAEWLAFDDPIQTLRFFRFTERWQELTLTERKWRLLACAFCRHIWHLLPDELSRSTVEVCECYLDGLADPQPLFARPLWEQPYAENTIEHAAYSAARSVGNCIEQVTGPTGASAEERAARCACMYALRAGVLAGHSEAQEAKQHCLIIRDIFGNPFRPVGFAPEWRTDTATAIARQMYESRDFGTMPILADALQDAGCDNDAVLTHCRDVNQVHFRGFRGGR